MRILIVHRYYFPDTPAYAVMLPKIAQQFVEAGNRVTVFTTQPCYNGVYLEQPLPGYEVVDGVEIFRTPLLRESKRTPVRRAINVGLFCWSLLVHCLFRFRRYQWLMVATFPPVVMGAMARLIGLLTGSKYIYHCQDLYPETALASGVAKKSWAMQVAASVDKRNCQRADHVVVLSRDMRQTLIDRGVKTDHLRIINNFILDDFDPELVVDPAYQSLNKNKFRVLFAGNLGRFQSLETIVAAAKLLASEFEIEFWFVGAGALVEQLQRQAVDGLERNVFFRPPVPFQQVMAIIAQSHLSVVSLSPGVIGCAYPSKTMSYLAAGCRLLVLVESDSELANFVIEQSVGAVCGEPTATAFAELIKSEFAAWKAKPFDREAIRAVGQRFFGQQVILEKWRELASKLE